jgi:hypothetical protein
MSQASATSVAEAGSIGNRTDGGVPVWVWGVGLAIALIAVVLFTRKTK